MKNFFIIALSCCFLIPFYACEKDDDNNDDKLPIVTSFEPEEINQNSVVFGGKVSDDRGYDIIDKGICWSTEPDVDIESNKISATTESNEFYVTLKDLMPNTTYYARAYATNKHGTGYGTLKVFETLRECPQTVEDLDGNVYQIVSIGNQCWFGENLKTTKYNDGSAIPLEVSPQPWINASAGLYCYYSNDYEEYGNDFGGLYNGLAVLTGKVCPENWKVPLKNDWSELIMFLGGEAVAGGKLKEEGLDFWHSPNNGANNESGFSARGGGYRHGSFGNFDALKHSGYWWSSTVSEEKNSEIHIIEIDKNSAAVHKSVFNKNYGVSIRCIKK